MDTIKFLDKYNLLARYCPVLISFLPISHFCFKFFGDLFFQEISNNIQWMLIADVSLALIVALFLMEFQCTIAKHNIEEKLFGIGGLFFPTTDMLLYNNEMLSKERKKRIREKITEKTGLKLSTEEEEKSNSDNARLQIREAIGEVRAIVGKGSHTIGYNIRYGFWRNLIGGSFIAIIGSLLCIIFYAVKHELKTTIFFVGFGIFFIIIWAFKRSILKPIAYDYADYLFTEFLVLEGEK
jgi:hypothetical protein